ARAFVVGLRHSAIGGIAAAALMFGASIAAGRTLGAAEYGQAIFVITVAQMFSVFAPLGFDVAMSRRLPRVESERIAEVVTTAVIVIAISTTVLALVAVSAVALVSMSVQHLQSTLVLAGIALGVALAARVSADRALSGMQLFRRQARMRPVEGVVVLLVLSLILIEGDRGWEAYCVALIVGASVVAARMWWSLREWISSRCWRASEASELRSYGFVTMLHAASPIGFVYADKFLVGRWLGSDALGVYGAYYAAGFLVVAQLLAIISNVLFPATAAVDDRRHLTRRLNKACAGAFFPAVFALTLVVRMIVGLFGDEFQPSWLTSVIAGTWGALLLVNGLLTTNAITHSRRAYAWVAGFQAFRSLFYVGAMISFHLTGLLSLNTAMLSLVMIELLDSLNLRTINRRIVSRSEAS
ncbi:MAG: oligosaccharide flippase family protein, partial [Thermoleophilia bacterium]|nr:oligosaccharide flippase family protein [Thermoleophilia bacterium]